LGLVLLVTKKIETSRLGFALKALKLNETAAEGMGVNTSRDKMIVFLISSAIGAIGGTIYAFSLLYVLTTHAVYGLFIIVRILSITIVGGFGTLWGPLIAAVLLVPTGEFLTAQLGYRLPGIQDVVYGAALVAAIIYLPDGIWGRVIKWLQMRAHKTGALELAASIPAISSVKQSTDGIILNVEQPKIEAKNEDEVLLRIENVCKYFSGVKALENLDLEIPRGKLLGIIGPNGSGKTTLFNVINGYMKPEKGRVLFEGVDTRPFKPNVLCKMGVGRTFQVPQIFRNMTILENIMVGAFAKTSDAAEARDIAMDVANSMGIADRINRLATGLHMWETKMVEFSRALSTHPKLLLLDEPMSGLNPEEAERIGGIIRKIGETGVTVIVIEHVVQSLVKIADFMVGLDTGRKMAAGKPADIICNPDVIEAYLGTKWRERYAAG
jgi:branched-chain amino acid transport system permease protein